MIENLIKLVMDAGFDCVEVNHLKTSQIDVYIDYENPYRDENGNPNDTWVIKCGDEIPNVNSYSVEFNEPKPGNDPYKVRDLWIVDVIAYGEGYTRKQQTFIYEKAIGGQLDLLATAVTGE